MAIEIVDDYPLIKNGGFPELCKRLPERMFRSVFVWTRNQKWTTVHTWKHLALVCSPHNPMYRQRVWSYLVGAHDYGNVKGVELGNSFVDLSPTAVIRTSLIAILGNGSKHVNIRYWVQYPEKWGKAKETWTPWWLHTVIIWEPGGQKKLEYRLVI